MFESLKNSKQFQFVYQDGKSYANKYLVMYVTKNKLDYNRIGISVSKKVGNSVVRHKVTRLIRESCRLRESILDIGFDVVIIARVGAKDRNYFEIESAYLHLLKLHGISKK